MIMDRLVTQELFDILSNPLNSTDYYNDSYESSDEELPELKRMPSPTWDSPVKKSLETKDIEYEFDEDFNLITKVSNDSGFSHATSEALDDSDYAILPEIDLNFSFDDLKISSLISPPDSHDDSFIKQW